MRVIRGARVTKVDPPAAPAHVVGDYGAGDGFAAALTYFLARGLSVEEACGRAGPFGASVLRGLDPLDVQSHLTDPDVCFGRLRLPI